MIFRCCKCHSLLNEDEEDDLICSECALHEEQAEEQRLARLRFSTSSKSKPYRTEKPRRKPEEARSDG